MGRGLAYICRTREEFVDRLDEMLQIEEVLAGIAAEKKWQLDNVASRLSDVFHANAVLQETVRRQATELEEQQTLRQKYQDQAQGMEELRQELAGRAMSQYKALSHEIREGGYGSLMTAMGKACHAERFTEVMALRELKKLAKRKKLSVFELCVELEYPEMETALATERTYLLYEQIVH
ncbi:unnamed protein product [Heligmosomoides polygyrus]|uniref:E3 ubiquitin protein ligase n=1 Tax=Heligmosomoides polygyrus TaxID=6339 RepID=A0A183GLM3_HELPZ|nr:unnamed protein product [Heligmosomoides polygyrus]